eukprot:COSAG02_NODE_9175_length_2301_cov_6.934151_1_plen_261_part_00
MHSNQFVTQLSSGYSAQGEVSDASLPPYNDDEGEAGHLCDTYAGLANTVQRAESSLTPNRYPPQQGVVDSEALLQEYRQQQHHHYHQQQHQHQQHHHQHQQQGFSTADGTSLAAKITGNSTDNTAFKPKPQLVKSHRESIAAVRAMVANKGASSSAKLIGTRAGSQEVRKCNVTVSSWPSTGNSADFDDLPAAAASPAQSTNQLESNKQTRVVQRNVVAAVEREIAVLQQRFLAHGTSLPLARQPALDVADGCDEFLLYA